MSVIKVGVVHFTPNHSKFHSIKVSDKPKTKCVTKKTYLDHNITYITTSWNLYNYLHNEMTISYYRNTQQKESQDVFSLYACHDILCNLEICRIVKNSLRPLVFTEAR